MTKVPDGQRALVLQGGGSLGAYEAGAYQALYERISKTDREKGDGKPFLNIVAGTSIGAINAAIIVSYVVENGTLAVVSFLYVYNHFSHPYTWCQSKLGALHCKTFK